ncbi:Isopenicillin N synthase [Cynara cardunculus var. scolymus]|uniref:Isopenicillin N synthase n=1 Tax=Cynara cardunculus var. scolymus TaxID=59895 RepID=A0A118JZB8_CYNCS|nr:Isopenicillin N synthase [Cynara cardunculus var. scolymus]
MVVANQMSPIRVEKKKIPTIDLSAKESQVSKLIIEACEEYGFFKVINHGVPHHIIKTMEDESFRFFHKALPEKQRVGPANPFGYGNRNIGLSGDTGELEYLLLQTNQNSIANACKLISSAPSKLSYTVNGYIAEVRRLACEILGLMAKGLGLPLQVFTTLLTDRDTDSLLRLNHYPPPTAAAAVSSTTNNPIGFGEHSDPQILTLLTSNDVPGLQLSLGNGHWLPVTPDPQAFCVIVGDLLQVAFTWADYKSHAYAHRLGETRLDHFKLS